MFKPLALTAAAFLTMGSAPGYPDNLAMIAEINALRADPQAFAADLKALRSGFRGKTLFVPGSRVGWETEEGVAAVDEAIGVLERGAPLPALAFGKPLAEAAGDHGVAQGSDGSEGHDGSGGDDAGERVKRRGGDIYVAEVIAYGSTSAKDALRQFVIDDGVADRGHREVLLDPEYRFAGAWCGPHPTWRQVCVVTLAATPDGSA